MNACAGIDSRGISCWRRFSTGTKTSLRVGAEPLLHRFARDFELVGESKHR